MHGLNRRKFDTLKGYENENIENRLLYQNSLIKTRYNYEINELNNKPRSFNRFDYFKNEDMNEYVQIKDYKMRELVKKLIKSESHRIGKNHNNVSHVSFQEYNLYLSKNNDDKHVNDTLKKEITFQNDFLPPINLPKDSTKILYSSNFSQNKIDNQLYYEDKIGNKYEISEIKTSDSNVLKNYTYNNSIEIPFELDKVIYQDIIKNPFKNGERTYRIAINKNIVNNPRENPKVVRIVVRKINKKFDANNTF